MPTKAEKRKALSQKPVVQLSGEDGNAFAVLSRCRRAAVEAGWTSNRIERIMDEMREGNYDHLLRVASKHFEVW